MEWLQANWEVVTIGALLVVRALESVAMVTETKKDDAFVAKIKQAVKHFFTFGWKSE